MNKTVGVHVIYPELSYQIMEVAYEIHNRLGPGFTEDIYAAAFVYELAERKLQFNREKAVSVAYKGHALGTYRLDLVIDNMVIVELKAVTELNDLFKQQLLSYLKATGLRLGILINFGAHRVQAVRVAN